MREIRTSGSVGDRRGQNLAGLPDHPRQARRGFAKSKPRVQVPEQECLRLPYVLIGWHEPATHSSTPASHSTPFCEQSPSAPQ